MTSSSQTKRGCCKRTSAAIRSDAEWIALRLEAGETLVEIKREYPCSYNTFVYHARVAIGLERWKSLVKRGARKGQFFGHRPNAERVSEAEARSAIEQLKAGRQAWLCNGCGHEVTLEELKKGPCPKCNGIRFEKITILSDVSDEETTNEHE